MEHESDQPHFLVSEIDHHVIALSFTTLNRLKGISIDAMTLYVFYCMKSKREGNTSIKATDSYCMSGLSWGKDRFTRAKKILRDEGIIETVTRRDENNKITGHYLFIHFLPKKARGTESHPVAQPEGGKQETNARDINISARDKKERLVSKDTKALRATEALQEKKTFGNHLINHLGGKFQQLYGITPIDTDWRRQAWALIGKLKTSFKRKGITPTDEKVLAAIDTYFAWLARKDWDCSKMRTVREHFPEFYAEVVERTRRNGRGVSHYEDYAQPQ
jgi:hypothetical protein